MRNAPLLLLCTILCSCTPAAQKIVNVQEPTPMRTVAAPFVPSWGFDPNDQIPDVKSSEWIPISSKEWSMTVSVNNQTRVVTIGTTKFYQSVHSNVVAAEYHASFWLEPVVLSWTVLTDSPSDSCCWFAIKGDDGKLHRANWEAGVDINIRMKENREIDMITFTLETVDVGKISRTFKNGATP